MKSSALIAKLKQFPVGVIGFVLSVVLLVLIYMRGGIIEEKQALMESLEADEKKMSMNLQNGVGIEEDLAAAQAIIDKVSEKLIEPENSLVNMRYFYSLESKAGIRMENPQRSSFVPAAKGQNYSVVKYNISATASLPDMLDFVLMLRSDKYLSVIESLNLEHSPSAQNQNRVSATVTVKILGK